jgi:hypothetical protein
MKAEIIAFIKEACKRYTGLEAVYLPSNDCYCVMMQGRAVQNFSTYDFYNYPKKQRMREYEALIKIGLASNLQERHKAQFFLNKRNGIKIA